MTQVWHALCALLNPALPAALAYAQAAAVLGAALELRYSAGENLRI